MLETTTQEEFLLFLADEIYFKKCLLLVTDLGYTLYNRNRVIVGASDRNLENCKVKV